MALTFTSNCLPIKMKLAVIATLIASTAAFSVSPKGLEQAAKAAAVAGVVGVVAASPAMAADLAAGEQIFSANCAACHAGGQNVIMPEKTLEKEALDQYLAGGRSAASIVTQVTNGKNAMPAFGGRLSDDDIKDVAAYVMAASEAGWE